MLSRIDENELLTALHAGLHEAPRWRAFLSRMCRRTRADQCWLFLSDANDPTCQAASWTAAASDTAHWETAAVQAFVTAPFRPGRVYGADDLGETSPSGPPAPPHVRLIRVADADDGALWLVLARWQGDFSAGDGAVLLALAPHLATVLRTARALDQARLACRIGDAVLERGGIGWALLRGDGKVALASPLGTGPTGHDIVRATAAEAAANGTQEVAFLPDGIDCSVVVDALEGWRAMDDGGSIGGSLVIMRYPPPYSDHQARLLARLYGLGQTEARLALLVANRHSIAEAAVTLGLTIETARNYTKRLYSKTGTRGMAELVRRVLLSASALS